MPLNSIPPTTTLSGLATKRACAKEVGVSCDLGFWGGLVPGNEGELRGLWEAGVKGFKCFLIESGVDVSFCRCRDEKTENNAWACRSFRVLGNKILSKRVTR